MPCVFDHAMKPQKAPRTTTPMIHDGCIHTGFCGISSPSFKAEHKLLMRNVQYG